MNSGTDKRSLQPITALLLLLMTGPAPAAASLAEWAGHYEDAHFNQSVDIDRQGRVKVAGYTFWGGDAGIPFEAEGTLRSDGDVFVMVLHPEEGASDPLQIPAELLTPRRLWPFVWSQHRVLLDDRDLARIANEVNLRGQHVVRVTEGLLEVPDVERHGAASIQINADTMLPPAWRARLLATPLTGHVVRIVSSSPVTSPTGPSSFAVGPPPRPGEVTSPPSPVRRVTVEVDLGAADRVYPGMLLIDKARGITFFWVDKVEAHRCTMSATSPLPVAVGDVVTSSVSGPEMR